MIAAQRASQAEHPSRNGSTCHSPRIQVPMGGPHVGAIKRLPCKVSWQAVVDAAESPCAMQRPHSGVAHDNACGGVVEGNHAALADYAAKANKTISLLQEELHTTSQFAIRLSRHLEDAKKERGAALREREAACSVAAQAAAHLHLLSNFLAGSTVDGAALPADIRAVIAGVLLAVTTQCMHAPKMLCAPWSSPVPARC